MTDNHETLAQDEALALQIMNEAFACLDRGDISGAESAADKLTAMRHSASFEVKAEILHARGDHRGAIEVLDEAVKAAPGVWLLWQSLGNAHTMVGQFGPAQEAYAQALACPAADPSTIHFNRGMAFARDRHFDEALEAFGRVTAPLLRFQAATFQLALCNDLNRFDRVLEQAREMLAEEAGAPDDRARIHAQMSRAFLQGYDDRPNAREHAELALKIWPQEPTARGVLGALARLDAEGAQPA